MIMPRNEVEKESSNKKRIKNKITNNKKNKNQIWYKIKQTKILRDEIEKTINYENDIKYWGM